MNGVPDLTALTSAQALNQVEATLDRFGHFGVELGLERIERLLAALDHPQRQVPIVHVAGSNGKGSVCAYLSSVLTEAGYRVGRYTSPHLVSWCERICLNQQQITPIELNQLLTQVLAAIDPNQTSPTQFEVITAAAWLYFAQQRVDIAVIEVGLGGRLDATNVCDQPLVSIITSLSREHWQRLGPTLADISREKAGILKLNCPAVIAPQPVEAATVLENRLSELNCSAFWLQPAQNLRQGWAEFLAKPLNATLPLPFPLDSLQYPLPLLGDHQLINSALAIAALQILQRQGWQITQQQIVDGMAKTQWQGRLQWFNWRDRKILIDGAHNAAGAEMLRRFLDAQIQTPIHWVIGMIANKDHLEVFQALLRPYDTLALVPVPEHLPVDLAQLKSIARQVLPNLKCDIYDDVVSGLEAAAAQSKQAVQEETIVLCGSLYLIGYFFQLQNLNPV